MFVSSGGRGSYSDIGGPVITTQVTIPKDVSVKYAHLFIYIEVYYSVCFYTIFKEHFFNILN